MVNRRERDLLERTVKKYRAPREVALTSLLILISIVSMTKVVDPYVEHFTGRNIATVRGAPTALSPLSTSSTRSMSIGRRIVETAFDDSYADLVRYCNNPSYTMEELRTCLTRLFKMKNNETLPYAQKWPWWFQTMLRDATARDGWTLFGDWHILQFQNPNLQLCVYEKGGTKAFRDFHCRAINKTHERSLFHCYEVQGDLLPYSEKGVFLRDPLDRFLSGFLDKCIKSRNREPHCEPTSVFADVKTALVKDLYSSNKKLFEAYVDAMPLKWNLHFFPQSLYCGGLYNEIKNYSFVGSMGNNFYHDLQRFSQQYRPLEPFVNNSFKLSANENKANEGVESKAASQVLDYYTPHTVRRVLEYLSIDYVTLNLAIPEWAEEMLANDAILR